MTGPKPPVQEAAVLVPLYRHEGKLRLVLVVRSEHGIHGGQIAFPGGKRDARDGSMLETALREAREETGLDLETTEILEHLPAIETMTSRFRIFPFLARVVPPLAWTPQEEEIAEVLEIPVEDLARPEAHGEALEHFPNWPVPLRIGFYKIGPHRLWGATYRILQPLLPRLVADEWEL